MPQNIQIGSRVAIAIDGEEREFIMVAKAEVAPAPSDLEAISSGSQIGKALLGKTVGDTVEIVIEGKSKLYRITSIQ